MAAWRRTQEHRGAHDAGRAGIFRDCRLRVAAALRDYGMTQHRGDDPADSREVHDRG